MTNRRVDPAELEGEELRSWYLRTPEEVEREKALKADEVHDEFFGDVRWQEAKAPILPPPPARPEVLGGALKPAGPSPSGAPGTFFGTYRPIPNPHRGPGYVTRLPPPLNVVEPTVGGRFGLSDGSIVTADELERVYAEQAHRMGGQDEEKVALQVRRTDRVAAGTIPDAKTMAQDEREDDPSCHPYGGWEREQNDPKRSQRSRDYEAQISRAPGLNYVVRAPDGTKVAFDGCAVWDPRRQLLEAKGPGYAGLAAFMEDDLRFPDFNDGPSLQAQRQRAVARGRPVDWHIAERRALPFFRKRVEIAPNFSARYTPPRANWSLL